MIVENDFHHPFCLIVPNLDEILYCFFSIVQSFFLSHGSWLLFAQPGILSAPFCFFFACHYFTIPFVSLFYLEIQGVSLIGRCGMKLDIDLFLSV